MSGFMDRPPARLPRLRKIGTAKDIVIRFDGSRARIPASIRPPGIVGTRFFQCLEFLEREYLLS
jgi:hypothetical protein